MEQLWEEIMGEGGVIWWQMQPILHLPLPLLPPLSKKRENFQTCIFYVYAVENFPFPAKELDNILRINRRKREKQPKVGGRSYEVVECFPRTNKGWMFCVGQGSNGDGINILMGATPPPMHPHPPLNLHSSSQPWIHMLI